VENKNSATPTSPLKRKGRGGAAGRKRLKGMIRRLPDHVCVRPVGHNAWAQKSPYHPLSAKEKRSPVIDKG